MSQAKTIAKNTSWLFIAELISKILALLAVIFIARYLGDKIFGVYSFVGSYVAIFLVVADLGITMLSTREIARNRDKVQHYLSNFATIKVVFSTISFLLILGIAQIINIDDFTRYLIYVAGVWTILMSLTEFLRGVFRAFEKMKYEALVRIGEKVLVFITVMLAIWLNLGVASIFWFELIASGLAMIVSLVLVLKNFTKFSFKFDFPFWKRILKEAWPFAASSVFIILYFKIDTVMLKQFGESDESIGYYNAAYNLVLALSFIPTAMLGAVYPVMARFYKTSTEKLKKVYRNAMKWLYFIALPIAVGTTFVAKPIIDIVYGQSFSGAIIALQVLVWFTLFTFMNAGFTTLINTSNRQKVVALQTALGVVVNVSLNMYLITKFSYMGAAIATIVTEAFSFAFLSIYIRNKMFKIQYWGWFLKISLSAATMAIVLYFINDYSPFIVIPTSVAVYALMSFSLGIIKKDEILRFRNMIKSQEDAEKP